MTAFAAMMGALFADPNIGADAVYTPTVGAPVPCRVVWRSGDRDVGGIWETGVTAASRVAEIRASEVPAVDGGTLTIGGVSYRVTKSTQPDPDRLCWRVELAP